MDRVALQKRYQRGELPVRLGGLAANLRRISSFARSTANREVVAGLLDESKYFIEWTAAEAAASAGWETAAQLVELQVQLARWQRHWVDIWDDPQRRRIVGEQSQAWSDRVLRFSGLLD